MIEDGKRVRGEIELEFQGPAHVVEADRDELGDRLGRGSGHGGQHTSAVGKRTFVVRSSPLMRLGIFSDIHANYEALTAVVEAFKSERIDRYYCLGDTVGYGGSPNECSDLVRDLVVATILGNHDAAVAGRMDYSYYYEAARHALDLHAQLLSEENMRWLKGLPYQITPRRASACTSATARRCGSKSSSTSSRPSRRASACRIFDELGHITLIGHSHLCKVFALTPTTVEELPPIDFDLQPNRKYIVSVGSVGQPRDYDNRASYTVYDTDKKRFEFKRVEYDIETAADKVLRAKLERNFAHRLFIGV